VLCYKDIDEIMFDKLMLKYRQGEKFRLKHNDRTNFLKLIFLQKTLQLAENLMIFLILILPTIVQMEILFKT